MCVKSRLHTCASGRQVVHREALALCFPVHSKMLHLGDSQFQRDRMLNMEGRLSNVYTLSKRDNSSCSAAREFSEPCLGLCGSFITYEEGIKSSSFIGDQCNLLSLSFPGRARTSLFWALTTQSRPLPCRASVVKASADNTALRAQAVVGLKIRTSNHKVLRQPAPSLGTFQKPLH